jgi:hypothetical protein
MAYNKEAPTPEEYAHRGRLNELTTRQNIHTSWCRSVVWSSFWLGFFGFLAWVFG